MFVVDNPSTAPGHRDAICGFVTRVEVSLSFGAIETSYSYMEGLFSLVPKRFPRREEGSLCCRKVIKQFLFRGIETQMFPLHRGFVSPPYIHSITLLTVCAAIGLSDEHI